MAWRADGSTALLERDQTPEGSPAAAGATRTAGRTVAALIGLNLVVQLGMGAVVAANGYGVTTAVRLSLAVGVVFYALTALATRLWARNLGLPPRLGTRHALVGAAEGVVVGAGSAVLLSALLRLLLGHPVLDPTSAALASGGAGWLLLGVLVVAVVAPVVEELVFRGFLLEAFRGRGARTAVLVSAVAFSLAHLRLAQFRYYVLMGVAFSLVYWRRGLVGSIAAHAAFNATLLMVAVAGVHAPAQDVSAAGFTVTLPAAWARGADVAGNDLVGAGPLGTRVELAHVDTPRDVDLDSVVRNLSGGSLPLPDKVTLDVGSVARIALPAGRAVSVVARIDGRPGRVVMVPKGRRLWVATLRSATDDHSAGTFDDILRSWRLP